MNAKQLAKYTEFARSICPGVGLKFGSILGDWSVTFEGTDREAALKAIESLRGPADDKVQHFGLDVNVWFYGDRKHRIMLKELHNRPNEFHLILLNIS